MTWNVYDSKSNWLGTVRASCEKDALEHAQSLYPDAAVVEEREAEPREIRDRS